MEIAIQKNDEAWMVYVEGISWTAITANFIEEFVNIYLLTFIVDGRFTGYDSRAEVRHNHLTFCKENMRVEKLLNILSEMQLDEPNDARFGNKKFFVNRLFHDAYVLTFWSREEAEKFIRSISGIYLDDARTSIREGKSYSTLGVTGDMVSTPNFDRFLDHRLNRWHDAVVKEFEEKVKNGEIPRPKFDR